MQIIFLNKVLDLDPLFKGGIGSTGLMTKMINWFYYELKVGFKLSYKKISGASRKIPVGWEAKMEHILTRVSSLQVEKLMENVALIPPVDDDQFSNTYHVPIYRDMPGNYSWGEKNAGNIQVGTGGGEKDILTVQFTVMKSGRKVRPVIIYKGAPLVNN